jgi:hypothetical protein
MPNFFNIGVLADIFFISPGEGGSPFLKGKGLKQYQMSKMKKANDSSEKIK